MRPWVVGALCAVLFAAGGLIWLVMNGDRPDGATDERLRRPPGRPPQAAPDVPRCFLSGRHPPKDSLANRPAVALKIENSPAAWPLSGLEDAEVVYEEVVEGGITRFLAIYHCSDTNTAGPIRSARVVDPTLMRPTTRILGFSGSNRIVQDALDRGDIVQVTQRSSRAAMRRLVRPNVTAEHTLYADTRKVRGVGARAFTHPPAPRLFRFGDAPESGGRRVAHLRVEMSANTVINYSWSGGHWLRTQEGLSFRSLDGDRIRIDNLIIQEHRVVFSRRLTDVVGNPSVEIEDVTGEGRAWLFRDGRMLRGTWRRTWRYGPVRYETAQGDPFFLHPGTTWIELLPDGEGDVRGRLRVN